MDIPVCPRTVPAISDIYGVAITVWAPAMSAQSIYHSQAIRAKPFALTHPFHFPPCGDPTPVGISIDSTRRSHFRVHRINLNPQSGRTLGEEAHVTIYPYAHAATGKLEAAIWFFVAGIYLKSKDIYAGYGENVTRIAWDESE